MKIYQCVQFHKNVCSPTQEVVVLISSSSMVLEISAVETWPEIDGLALPWPCKRDTYAVRWAHFE